MKRLHSFCFLLACSLLFHLPNAAEGQTNQSRWLSGQISELFRADGYVEGRGYKWRPDPEEALEFMPSDDGYNYTTVDTVFLAVSPNSIGGSPDSTLVVTFVTRSFSGRTVRDCHACGVRIGILLYTIKNGVRDLARFHKMTIAGGSWGAAPHYRIELIGPQIWGLIIEDGYSGQGYVTSSTTIYPLSSYYPFIPFFTTVTRDGGPEGCEAMCDDEYCSEYRMVNREWTFVAAPESADGSDLQEFYDISASVTESSCQEKKVTWTEYYVADYTGWHARFR